MAEVWLLHVLADLDSAEQVRRALAAAGVPTRLVAANPGPNHDWNRASQVLLLHTTASRSDSNWLTLAGEAHRLGRRPVLLIGDESNVAPGLDVSLGDAGRYDMRDGLSSLVVTIRANPKARKDERRAALKGLKLDEPNPEVPNTANTWKGWGASIALHALLLVVLALLVFRTNAEDPAHIDGSMIAGDPNGDLLGLARVMGGTDETALPHHDDLTAQDGPTLQLTPLADLRLGPSFPKLGGGPGLGGGLGGDGFGMTRFGPGSETIRGVEVRTGDPQFTLLWDTGADLDLHVIEPGGAHIYWVEKGRPTKLGGTLDVDNVKGFGPENVYWQHGQGPPGEYKWYVQYFGGFGGYDVPTKWQVRIKRNGEENIVEGRFRRIGEKSKVYSLKVGPTASKEGP